MGQQPSYKVGYCPQCGSQIMVKDTLGKWVTFKSNFRQIYLTMSNGMKVKSTICSDCYSNPDLEKIMSAITNIDSEACNPDISKKLIEMGIPSKMDLATNARQGMKLNEKL